MDRSESLGRGLGVGGPPLWRFILLESRSSVRVPPGVAAAAALAQQGYHVALMDKNPASGSGRRGFDSRGPVARGRAPERIARDHSLLSRSDPFAEEVTPLPRVHGGQIVPGQLSSRPAGLGPEPKRQFYQVPGVLEPVFMAPRNFLPESSAARN